MSNEKHYYELLNKETGDIECYLSIDLPVKEEKVCELIGLNDYTARKITREEYEERTDDEE